MSILIAIDALVVDGAIVFKFTVLGRIPTATGFTHPISVLNQCTFAVYSFQQSNLSLDSFFVGHADVGVGVRVDGKIVMHLDRIELHLVH